MTDPSVRRSKAPAPPHCDSRQESLVPRWNAAESPSAQRISEVGDILALGIIRLVTRKSSQNAAKSGETSLDFTRLQSGDRDRSPLQGGLHG